MLQRYAIALPGNTAQCLAVSAVSDAFDLITLVLVFSALGGGKCRTWTQPLGCGVLAQQWLAMGVSWGGLCTLLAYTKQMAGHNKQR